MSWAEAVQDEGQSLLQSLREFQLLLLNLRFVKRLISTVGVAVLRVPEAEIGKWEGGTRHKQNGNEEK